MHEAELLFSEASADIALIRLRTPVAELPHAALGNSDRLAVGQTVYVIGAPYSLENSYSIGTISGFREFNRGRKRGPLEITAFARYSRSAWAASK